METINIYTATPFAPHCYPGASFAGAGQLGGSPGGESIQLINLRFIGSNMTKLYKMRRMAALLRRGSVVGRGHLNEFMYWSIPDTVTFRYGDTEGAAIFLDSGVSTLNLYPSIRQGNENAVKKPRQTSLNWLS